MSDTIATTPMIIPATIYNVFLTWLSSVDNHNRTRFDEEKYLEYKSFLSFPNSKIPHDIKNNIDAIQKWSNQKRDALSNYELVKGQVFRKAGTKYPQR